MNLLQSSFLGKLTKSSISEGSRKRGSNVVRGYIFERDDSNSKSSNSVPEEPSVPETVNLSLLNCHNIPSRSLVHT